jgi:hypothetical protein
MNEPLPKEDVTLEKLRFAVARVEAYRAMPIIEAIKCGIGWAAAERDAWKAAFEWLHTGMRGGLEQTYEEGMALIREKLS